MADSSRIEEKLSQFEKILINLEDRLTKLEGSPSEPVTDFGMTADSNSSTEKLTKLEKILIKVGERITKLEGSPSQSTPDFGIAMVEIPGGTFLMGDEDSEDEKPIHLVNVEPFTMSEFVITQSQWRAVASSLPRVNRDLNPEPQSEAPDNLKGDSLPIIMVSWLDAKEFCARLSRSTGQTYRLPSEAEWEYACRAGTTTKFNFGDQITEDKANYADSEYEGITPAGQYPPNAFGLYDMHGNVFEWCQDIWHDSYDGAPSNGTAWMDETDSQRRVLRGGCWSINAEHCRSANRYKQEPDTKNSSIGFRVVCS